MRHWSLNFILLVHLLFAGKPTLKLILHSLFFLLLSWLASALVVVVTALALQSLGRAMSWFSHPLLILPLYALPTFVTIATVHSYWIYKVSELYI